MSARPLRRLACAIALLAILLVSFAPGVTGLFAAPGGLGLLAVCSATGSPLTASAAAAAGERPASPDDPAGSHMLDHCPYCALHAEMALPPAVGLDVPLRAVAFRERPARFLRGPRTAWVWSAAQPRAPPLSA